MRRSLEAICWGGERRELGEYADLSWDPDSGVIQELVERLHVVGMEPQCVGFAWKLSCGIATVRLGRIQDELGEAPIDLLMRSHSI